MDHAVRAGRQMMTGSGALAQTDEDCQLWEGCVNMLSEDRQEVCCTYAVESAIMGAVYDDNNFIFGLEIKFYL